MATTKRRPEVKTLTAWAILEGDTLVVFDGRCPIYWLRRIAKLEAEERHLYGRLVRVEIKPARKRK